MKQNFFLLLFLTAFNGLLAQSNATITVTDVNSGLPVQGAGITLSSSTLQTDVNGQAVFAGLANGSYSYTISKMCYLSTDNEVVIADSDLSINQTLSAQSTNSIYVSMSNFGFNPSGFSVNLSNGSGFSQTITSGNPLGDIFEDIPFGTYTYTVTKNCFQTSTGEVVVNCNGGDPDFISAIPQAVTTNSVFFFMSNFGFNPSGFSINLTNGGSFNQTITSGNPLNDMIENVPFGTYTYTISKNCFETITGQVTVNCNNGEGNIVSAIPSAVTSNSIYVSMSNFGFNPSGFSVNLSNGSGFSQTITSGNPLGDMFENIPFGTYTYTVTKNCFQTATGEVVVSCNGGEPNFVSAIPTAVTTNSVSFFMSNFGFNPSGFSINLTNGGSFNQTIASGNPLNDIIENVPFGTYIYTISKNCFETITGQVTVNCNTGDGNVVSAIPSAVTTNSIYVSMSNFGFNPSGFSVNLSNGSGFSQTITSGNPLGDIFEDIPFGTYTYTVTKNCFQTSTGEVVVNCNGGDPDFISAIPQAVTTNSVFFFMSNFGFNPSGFSINLTNGGSYNQTISSGNPLNDMFENIPFGTYTYTISKDCHQTITGQVTVACNNSEAHIVSQVPVEVVLNNTVTQASNVLTANATGVAYQWLDCNNNNEPIENQTGQVFTATVNGSYAVEVSNENCSVVSSCFTVSDLSVGVVQKTVAMTIYPNPANENINIKFDKNFEALSVEIISMTGQVVKRSTATHDNLVTINISDLAQGVYILKAGDKENSTSSRIVKR